MEYWYSKVIDLLLLVLYSYFYAKESLISPEVARGSREEQLAYLREQRAGIEHVIAVLERLDAFRTRPQQESAA